MTLTELQALSAACKTDAEFLDKARRVYWKAMGNEGPWKHREKGHSGKCSKCGELIVKRESYYYENEEYNTAVWWSDSPCPEPDPIPGSPSDAAEALRVKVAEKYREPLTGIPFVQLNDAAHKVSPGLRWYDRYVIDEPRIRIMIFLCALGAVEVEDKNGTEADGNEQVQHGDSYHAGQELRE